MIENLVKANLDTSSGLSNPATANDAGGQRVVTDALYPVGFKGSDAGDSSNDPNSVTLPDGAAGTDTAAQLRWVVQQSGAFYRFRTAGTESPPAIAPADRGREPGVDQLSAAATANPVVGDAGLAAPSLAQGSGATIAAGSGSSVASGATVGIGSTSTSQVGAAGGLVFDITWDSSVSSAPAGFTTAIIDAAQFLASTFHNPITINLAVGWGETGGQGMSSGSLGESTTNLNTYNYSQVRSALIANATSPAQQAAYSTLPTSDPTGSNYYSVATGEAKALGLTGPSGSSDGAVGFGTGYAYSFDPNNRAVSGEYDFIGIAEHEISEVMGRDSYLGEGLGYTPLDLFRYSASGARQFTGGAAAYFSTNGGATDLANFNTDPGGDYGDWDYSAGNDSSDAFSNPGVVNAFGSVDQTSLNVLGFALTGTASPSPTPSPTPTPTPVPTPASTPLSSIPLADQAPSDFYGNGISDLLWQNASGQTLMWQMNGVQVSSNTVVQPNTAWRVSASGDFYGSGTDAILWHNASSGITVMAQMSAGQSVGSTIIAGDPNWTLLATGDFNGDGKTDILWRNPKNAFTVMWQMNGSQTDSTNIIAADPNWTFDGVGDFFGNGKDDILWHNAKSGFTVMWEMNGIQVAGSTIIGGDPNWQVSGIGDFNGDGKSDILWTNASTGITVMNQMNGFQTTSSTIIAGDPNWKVSGVGDFNGDGKSDIVWYNRSSGTSVIWEMSGTQTLATGIVNTNPQLTLVSPIAL